jgi:hypothetical protein
MEQPVTESIDESGTVSLSDGTDPDDYPDPPDGIAGEDDDEQPEPDLDIDFDPLDDNDDFEGVLTDDFKGVPGTDA